MISVVGLLDLFGLVCNPQTYVLGLSLRLFSKNSGRQAIT